MSTENNNLVIAHVGGKEEFTTEWKTIRAVFHDFDPRAPAPLSKKTEALEVHGLRWKIEVSRGKGNFSVEVVSFDSLPSLFEKGKAAKARFRVKVPSIGLSIGRGLYLFAGSSPSKKWTIPRNRFDDAYPLVDGNLILEVDIQAILEVKPPAPIERPHLPNTVCSDLLGLLDDADENTPDTLTFRVGSDDDNLGGKETFFVHKLVLAMRCPFLSEMAESNGPGTAVIDRIQPDIFRVLLRFIYGGEIPSADILDSKAGDILCAADYVECEGLKLAVEWELACSVSMDNVIERLLFADSHSCGNLKKVAVDYAIANAAAIKATGWYQHLRESDRLFNEVFQAESLGPHPNNDTSSATAPGDSDEPTDVDAFFTMIAIGILLAFVWVMVTQVAARK